MRTIKASEIGTYIFCQRAWWYQNNGYQPDNQAELAGGREIHAKHARIVRISSSLQALAITLLLVALALGVLWFLKVRF